MSENKILLYERQAKDLIKLALDIASERKRSHSDQSGFLISSVLDAAILSLHHIAQVVERLIKLA